VQPELLAAELTGRREAGVAVAGGRELGDAVELDLEFASSGPPSDPHRPDPLGGAAEEQVTFVFGVIGADVARVAYEPTAAEPTELHLYQLGADVPQWQAYGGFVAQPVAGSHVVAYDAAGAEIGRSVDLRWP
jgi:hypothetical protein